MLLALQNNLLQMDMGDAVHWPVNPTIVDVVPKYANVYLSKIHLFLKGSLSLKIDEPIFVASEVAKLERAEVDLSLIGYLKSLSYIKPVEVESIYVEKNVLFKSQINSSIIVEYLDPFDFGLIKSLEFVIADLNSRETIDSKVLELAYLFSIDDNTEEK
jgi:hypothetical protein